MMLVPTLWYLRSFRADGFRPALWFRVSTDEVDLEIAVRPLGDLIAIGRPGEFLPTPGAAREYPPTTSGRTPLASECARHA